jgi:hypothetical protein
MLMGIANGTSQEPFGVPTKPALSTVLFSPDAEFTVVGSDFHHGESEIGTAVHPWNSKESGTSARELGKNRRSFGIEKTR